MQDDLLGGSLAIMEHPPQGGASAPLTVDLHVAVEGSFI